MLSLVLAIALVAQAETPPPPTPEPPPSVFSPGDVPPETPQGKKEWLLAHLIADMQVKGKYDPAAFKKYSDMLDNMNPTQLGTLVQYYRLRKDQVAQQETAMRSYLQAQAVNQAQLNLKRAEAYRDILKQELERRMIIKQQELAITQQSSAIATMQMWNVLNSANYGWNNNGAGWNNGWLNNGYQYPAFNGFYGGVRVVRPPYLHR